MNRPSRREFVRGAAVAAAGIGTATHFARMTAAQSATALAQADRPEVQPVSVQLHLLDGKPPAFFAGTTWGVPWPRGTLKVGQALSLKSSAGDAFPVQTWTTATWPDGSIKWTAHALPPSANKLPETATLAPGDVTAPSQAVNVRESDQSIDIDTGVIRCRIARRGEKIMESIERDGKPIASDVRLVCLSQDRPETDSTEPVKRESFASAIESVTVEQTGPVRAVVRVEGKHVSSAAGAGGRAWLPFVLRFYFYAGSDAVRVMHTFVFDGDEQSDFIAGLGLRFDVPMRDQPHDRHVRFVNAEGHGMFAEAVRGLTGLRRDAGEPFREAQVRGEPTPRVSDLPDGVRDRLRLIPAWGDYTLSQLSADGFDIRKRTKPGHGWIRAGAGRRASGVGYVGSISGGVAFGMRDFWQRHPTQLDIRNAATDQASVTMWLWSPDAPPMDLRFYHDGMGMDSHREELEGLEITYEDFEKGFGTPHGIARTNELWLWATGATPPRQRLAEFSDSVSTPALLACAPEHYVASGVFGSLFNVVDRSAPQRTTIETALDFLTDYYLKQIDERRWYGFWDHGDVMHSYDRDRHEWRYDVGGYAWDNGELSPELWLWYSYLRSGRADIFRMAEAMSRHVGEVDTYHAGRFKGLGSRHNVQHWGCSAKQLRISTAIYRRFLYFLTADERVSDLLHELIDADQTFLTLDPIRKIRQGAYKPDPHALAVGFGTDWGSLAAAWLAEWERTGDARVREKLVNGMKSIGSMPYGFFTGGALYDPDTGAFKIDKGKATAGVSHLSAVFGLLEVCAELIVLLDVPEFEKAWLDYCELYNASREERIKRLGEKADFRTGGLTSAHSRLTAYAARKKKDPALAKRAWGEFVADARWAPRRYQATTTRIDGPAVLNPIDEAAWVSTNDSSQWSLAAIQNLAMIGDALPASFPALPAATQAVPAPEPRS